MPIQNSGSKHEYFLIAFDAGGKERTEAGGLFSDVVNHRVGNAYPAITDVFLMSHGWLGDVPAAITQYDRWVRCVADNMPAEIDVSPSNFQPLTLGLHWPSLPWGDETIPTNDAAVASEAIPNKRSVAAQLEDYASKISNTPKATAALQTVLSAAKESDLAAGLSPAVLNAYRNLFEETGLPMGSLSQPGADQNYFDPNLIISQAHKRVSVVEGICESVRDILLAPLRVLSFWKMKERARIFGETGANALLSSLQKAAPKTRFHLVGHSFGCIVASGAILGPPNRPDLSRPVSTLIHLQGALSLWAFASNIPYPPNGRGYYRDIIDRNLVRGTIVTTQSRFDKAVGWFYPLGAEIAQDVKESINLPKYGGIGSFGMEDFDNLGDPQRDSDQLKHLEMKSVAEAYAFAGSVIYNLDANKVIKDGNGIAGAHSDIAHPEVAHAFWDAVLAGQKGAQS